MRVGFIGLGFMGNPMAGNLQKAGYHPRHLSRAWQKPRRCRRNMGNEPVETAARSEVVLLSLPGPVEVESVVMGETGVFAGLSEGGACIDTSTNAPAVMRRITEAGASIGIQVLDAPISGGVFGARDATLTVFVGGEKTLFEQYRPLLQCIGKTVVHMGPSGSGNVTKLVNNLMMYVNFIGACEGMAMGVKAGIDPQTLLDVIKPSMGHSIFLERTMQLFLEGESLHSATDLAVKDMHLGVELGKEIGVPLAVSPLVEALLTRFRDAGNGQEDTLEYIRDYMRRSGVNMSE